MNDKQTYTVVILGWHDSGVIEHIFFTLLQMRALLNIVPVVYTLFDRYSHDELVRLSKDYGVLTHIEMPKEAYSIEEDAIRIMEKADQVLAVSDYGVWLAQNHSHRRVYQVPGKPGKYTGRQYPGARY